jgi:hypothetical protein
MRRLPSRPLFASLLFLFGENANLAGGFAGRRCWWFVFSCLFHHLPLVLWKQGIRLFQCKDRLGDNREEKKLTQ